jgi:HAD superfamily hydrolase (TIGR01549 family)
MTIFGVPFVKTMLLDIDGTLVDSNDRHAESWVLAFADSGMTVAFDRVRPLIGMGSDKLLPSIDPSLSKERDPGKTIAKRRAEIFKERFIESIEPMAGARELLLTLQRLNVACVIATSANSDELDILLERTNLKELVDDATTAQDADRSKPSPDVIEAALEKAGASAEASIMLGDTRYDIEAASKAGVPCIALRCGGSTEADLGKAVALFDDPADLARYLQDVASAVPR